MKAFINKQNAINYAIRCADLVPAKRISIVKALNTQCSEPIEMENPEANKLSGWEPGGYSYPSLKDEYLSKDYKFMNETHKDLCLNWTCGFKHNNKWSNMGVATPRHFNTYKNEKDAREYWGFYSTWRLKVPKMVINDSIINVWAVDINWKDKAPEKILITLFEFPDEAKIYQTAIKNARKRIEKRRLNKIKVEVK